MSGFSDRIKLWVDKATPHTDRVRQFFSNRMLRFEATLSSLVNRYRIGEQWICETDGSDAGRKQPRLLTLLLIGLLFFLIFEFSATMPWWPYFVALPFLGAELGGFEIGRLFAARRTWVSCRPAIRIRVPGRDGGGHGGNRSRCA